MMPVVIFGGFTREQLSAWLDVAEREIEIERVRQRIKNRIATREREERCRCGDPTVVPPCSYCEGGGDEASIDRD